MEFTECDVCGFGLWNPIASLSRSTIGLYNDARFPGRCIVSLDIHKDNFEELDEETTALFMEDIQKAMRAIKSATGADRVNMAILGNAESHVHAHLIPRYPDSEEFPKSSPWNDKRERAQLDAASVDLLRASIRLYLLSNLS